MLLPPCFSQSAATIAEHGPTPALASSGSVGARSFLGPFGSRSLQRVAAAGASQAPASWAPHVCGLAPSVVEAAP
eukprot:353783-Alexandrium_andersonii.AAC.1